MAPAKKLKYLQKNIHYYILLIPAVLYFIIFKYIPMAGIVIAFKNYMPFVGFVKSPWVGLKHFEKLFTASNFWQLLGNTLTISVMKIVFGFPIPIILALLLNELKNAAFKRTVQTVIYLPHFISWVILSSIVFLILSPSTGVVNYIIKALGGEPIFFLANKQWFRPVIVITDIWKEMGWGTIVYLAAISGVNPEIYESARVDGANRWKQTIYITLPCIRSVIITLLILRLGRVMNVGFTQILLLYNEAVYEVADVLETFVYRVGITQGNFSFTTAVGLFNSTVALILVIVTNKIAKMFGEAGIW